MKTVEIRTGKPYEVKIGKGLLNRTGQELLQLLGRTCTAAILTDDTVDGLYGGLVQKALESRGFQAFRFAVPHGEKNKTLAHWGGMLDFLADHRLTRSDIVVALGGGVPGDMAGFAAACYLRGVDFIQVPTTLLAMADSSVGGKTGVDLTAGKNLAGAFHQPRLVLCDPEALETLPGETLLDGVAESIKHGVLQDPSLFQLFEENTWRDRLETVVERDVTIKAAFVTGDERDTGRRQQLNLGHTFAHALETCSDFQITHGHAVGVGMAYAARLAFRLGLCGEEVPRRILNALNAVGLPMAAAYGPEELARAALSDKKRMGDTVAMVLPREIGRCELVPVMVDKLPEWFRMAMVG